MSATLEVKWGGKKFPVEFQNTRELETTTVKELKAFIQRMTGIDSSQMKLQAFGALMSNDDMPLSIYGLRPGCYITMKLKGNKSKREEAPKQQQQQQQEIPPSVPSKKSHEHKKHNHHHHKHHQEQQQPEEQLVTIATGEDKLIEKVQVIQNKIDKEITPQVKKYEKDSKEFMSKSVKTDKKKKKQIYMGAYLGEQLMHVLFDLDSFTCGPDNLIARQKRKEAVKVAQALLDKVDEIKSVVKNVTVSEEQHE